MKIHFDKISDAHRVRKLGPSACAAPCRWETCRGFLLSSALPHRMLEATNQRLISTVYETCSVKKNVELSTLVKVNNKQFMYFDKGDIK